MKKKRNCGNRRILEHVLESLHVIFDGIGELVYISDPNTFDLLFANEKLEKSVGRKIYELKCYEVFQKLDNRCSFCNNKYIFGKNIGKTHTMEFQNKKNGQWYKCISKAIKWPGEKVVRFGMAIDITQHKQTEESLLETNTRLQALIQTIPDVVYFKDTKRRNLIVNKAFEMLACLKQEQIIGKTDEKLFPENLAEQCRISDEAVVKKKKALHFEEHYINKRGETQFFDTIKAPLYNDQGKIAGLVGVSRDITDRKKSEKEIKVSEKKYKNLFENARDLIMTFDLKGNVISINKAIAEYGFSEDELVGKNLRQLLSKKYWPKFSKDLANLTQGKPVKGEIDMATPRGRAVLEYRSNPLKQHEKVSAVHTILRDITERKRFERSLSTLSTYGQSLNAADNAQRILTLTLDAMETTLGFEFADIFLVEGKILRLVAHRGISRVLDLTLPIDGQRGIVVKAARLGKPVFVADVRKERAYVDAGTETMLSELAVPIKMREKVLGVLNVESEKLRAFDEKDSELLETLAAHNAIAMTNLKMQEKLSALNTYGRNLNKAENVDEIYNQTLKAMEKTLGFEYASFLIIEGEVLRVAKHCGYPERLDIRLPLDGRKGITVRAARLGKPVLVADVRKDKAYIEGGLRGMLSELAVPVKIDNRILAVLNVESERLAAFDEDDKKLLEILASHGAIAMSKLTKQNKLRKLSDQQEYLMKSTTKIMHAKDMHQRLKVIAAAIKRFGWRRVVISLRNEDLEGIDVVTAGLSRSEVRLLLERKASGAIWRERLGPKFARFKINEFYYLPWMDPWVREHVHHIPHGVFPEHQTTYAGVPSSLRLEEMIDWHPQDMLYAPLRTPDGRIVGILSMDDPADGRKPTAESLSPLEIFLHQAAVIIENCQLIGELKETRGQLEVYTGQLEQKIEERTQELKKSQSQLLKTQRLAVIGELAGMVGHDLRNPLTSINGAAYYLKKRLVSKMNGKAKEMLELIEKNIMYSNKIINDLLDYSKEMTLDIAESNPKSIVDEALSLVKIPRNIQVINLAKSKPRIKIDIGKTKRAFVNIIKNSIDAMPEGGTLAIKTKKLRNNLEIMFSDNGIGMSKRTLEKLWTPLFTTKAKGMGFGLPICKRIVNLHGGSISVKSIPRKGTTITISIPTKLATSGGEKIWIKPLESSLSTTMKT